MLNGMNRTHIYTAASIIVLYPSFINLLIAFHNIAA